jgi:hypothetical protein
MEGVREEARKDTRRKSRSAVSPFVVAQPTLRGLNAIEAVEAIRDLLWAKAAERQVLSTQISCTSEVTVADGGVDLAVLDGASHSVEGDDVIGFQTRFQIKTGDFSPWRTSVLKKELFGSKPAALQNLGREIRHALDGGRRLVFVCFGVDLTVAQRRQAREHLERQLSTCGYDGANVDFWGQSELIGLLRAYPSLCLKLIRRDHAGFRSISSWASDQDMQPTARFSPEQTRTIEELRHELRSAAVAHLRLVGEPGVGKTRMAFEIVNCDELRSVSLYVRDGRSLLRSSLINELLESDDRRFTVLIVDECPAKDRAEIWNLVRAESERIRLVTIDHGPDDSVDPQMRKHQVDPATLESIIEILMDHQLSELDAKRWAQFCQGCPRVAHMLGENLRRNRSDLLQSPAEVDVWDRFIVGYDDANSEDVRLRRIVLHYVSLFARFGFEKPVQNEAIFIAKLCEIPWPRFQLVVHQLKQRRILQGTRTLYVTPELLHVHLYREFWRIHGPGFDVARAIENMPGSLERWFVDLFQYAHDVPAAEQSVEHFLGPNGIFSAPAFPNEESAGTLVRVLAEASPRATLRCLNRTIGKMSVDELRRLDRPRQSIVWALEKIAVWDEFFSDAANLLLKLAEGENSNHANNATGTFQQLFDLTPGMAPTEVAPSRRIPVLEGALSSNVPARRLIGLGACEAALARHGNFRLIGPEHQGLRKTIKFWIPQTRQELIEAHRSVLNLVIDRLSSWTGDERALLIRTLIKTASSTLYMKDIADTVVGALATVAADPATDMRALIDLLRWHAKDNNNRLPPNVKDSLKRIYASLYGRDFASTAHRFVKWATTDDFYDEDLKRTTFVEDKLRDLAEQAINDNDLLFRELPWLVCENSGPGFGLAFEIGMRDPCRSLFPHILSHYRDKLELTAPSFASGYLAAIYEKDSSEWERVILELAEDPVLVRRFSDLVIESGLSDRTALKVVELCRRGAQEIELLGRWTFSARLGKLSRSVAESLLQLQIDAGSERIWSNAIAMCRNLFFSDGRWSPLPEALVFNLLTHHAIAESRSANLAFYHWSEIANSFLVQYPQRIWDLFNRLLRLSTSGWALLLDLNTHNEHVLTKILRSNPETAFTCIADVVMSVPRAEAFGIQSWLADDGHRGLEDEGPGAVQHIPSKTLFKWVDENVDERGPWLARVMPKTLDRSDAGRLTRDFLARYGKIREIASELGAHFYSRGWAGNASDYYRELREEARTWLVDERDSNVIRWVDDYIESLSVNIEQAETIEEREG